jgi:ABC-2 type transport system ATP-binding protein
MPSILRAEEVQKRFRRLTVLDGLDLEVPEGSVYGLVGSNGAGKTTTIKILMNIVRANAGRCEVLGKDSRSLGPEQFAQIGYVSENQSLPGWMTVQQYLTYLKPFYTTWDDGRAEDLLRRFELPGDRKIRQLSRGMWMKAALVSSLAYHPKLLVLDEPFSGLDPVVRDDFIQGILESAEESTVLISSHDLAEMESFASHIGFLDKGRMQFSEEMSALTARFREVEVAVEQAAVLPDNGEWPRQWLRPEAAATVVRFIDSRFDEDATANEIRRLFRGVRNVSASPVPLRTIFVALARSASKGN